jgi:hypothetical protein
VAEVERENASDLRVRVSSLERALEILLQLYD